MSILKLYNYDLDENCYKVRLLVSLLGIEMDVVSVDVFPGKEHLSPSMLALNPTGQLPTLCIDDEVLFGPEAILAYLAKSYPKKARLLPEDPTGFGQTMKWLMFSAHSLDAAVKARATSMLAAPGDIETLRLAARDALRIMEDHMTQQQFAGHEFFTGDVATIADIALFPGFALSRDFNIDHDAFPALRRWARHVRKLDGFITMPGIPDYH